MSITSSTDGSEDLDAASPTRVVQDARKDAATAAEAPATPRRSSWDGRPSEGNRASLHSAAALCWASVTNPQFIQRGAMGGHVEYCVTFGFSETNQRCVWKRFSEFETLHKELCKNYPIVQKIKGFPKKTGTFFMTRLHASLDDGSTFPPFFFFHLFFFLRHVNCEPSVDQSGTVLQV